ncbi:MAG: endolytic transglycosylase MltG [Candidatus Pacebacteria bacterium]|nr:endolytic transglycosylase MltG [Candidatus Paceibacterota bacterium]MCF7857254.1 endolytic transglycosylase MltG [Candidatus Paceibacterota bacterium]
MHLSKLKTCANKKIVYKTVYFLSILVLILFAVSVVFFVLLGKQKAQEYIPDTGGIAFDEMQKFTQKFPVGVYPIRKEIIESPLVELYFEDRMLKEGIVASKTGWIEHALGKLALVGLYQNIASLSSRLLVIEPGERKEQIADHFAEILKWDTSSKQEFLDQIINTAPEIPDGKFFPGTYTVARGATPNDVSTLIIKRFDDEVFSRYGDDTEKQVPLADILTIASMLEREAYDFVDMRLISGVIWNRLFIDMNLQIDATLQYAKGSKDVATWWPKVVPSDKYIASVYNTYKNSGLPPSPIANPSIDSILAALNPRKTDCMFYFHDKQAGFHCSSTYEGHVKLLKEYYGSGK